MTSLVEESVIYRKSCEAFIALLDFLEKTKKNPHSFSKDWGDEMKLLCEACVDADISSSNKYLASVGYSLPVDTSESLREEKVKRLMQKCTAVLLGKNF